MQQHRNLVICWLVAVVASLSTLSAVGSYLDIEINIDGTSGAAFKINHRFVSESEGRAILRKLGELDVEQYVRVLCATNVSATQLMMTLNAVQDAGFRHVGVACPGNRDGTNGICVVTLDFTDALKILSLYGVEGKSWPEESGPAGFYPNTSKTVRAIGPLITPQATNSFMVVTNGLNGRMVNLATNAAPGK